MLSHLVIRNFAIIDHLEIPFQRGLTVLSGETGAGKSIIIDALNLILGGRASTDVIRTDEDQAVVEACFELNGPNEKRVDAQLEELGIESTPGQLVIRRIVSRNGRNKVFINGCISTVSTLRDVTLGLVDISGQHEHYSLLQADRHLELLDEFGVLGDQVTRMRSDYDDFRALQRELESLQTDVRDRLHRIDFLRYQLEEIDAVGLEPGEEETLKAELNLLKNAERITDASSSANYLIYDAEESAGQQVAAAKEELSKIADCDPRLAELVKRLDDTRFVLEDVSRELATFAREVDDDPRRLDTVIGRLEAIKKLKRKHGYDVEVVLEEAEAMRKELDRLENSEALTEELEQKVLKARQHAYDTAVELSKERRDAALLLAREIEKELKDLGMDRASFEVSFDHPSVPDFEACDLNPAGLDRVEFMVNPNLGEDAKPLARVASGGELSRIMLAIKRVLAIRDSISTYVFDEVDAGIGGSTADMVGQKISETAVDHQVLCITHLPQIASRGDHHYVVAKSNVGGRTQSSIRPLDDKERVEELARMLGGSRATDTTREAAQELLGLR